MSVELFSMSFNYGTGFRDAPQGLKEFKVGVERVGIELGNFEQHLWPKLQEELEGSMKEQFDGEGVGQAGPWASLDAKYRKWKSQHGFGDKILVRTGALRDSLTSASSASAIRRADSGSFSFGSTLHYSSYHQTGTSRMVARPPLDLPNSFEKKLKRIMAAAARDALKEAKEVGLELQGDE